MYTVTISEEIIDNGVYSCITISRQWEIRIAGITWFTFQQTLVSGPSPMPSKLALVFSSLCLTLQKKGKLTITDRECLMNQFRKLIQHYEDDDALIP